MIDVVATRHFLLCCKCCGDLIPGYYTCNLGLIFVNFGHHFYNLSLTKLTAEVCGESDGGHKETERNTSRQTGLNKLLLAKLIYKKTLKITLTHCTFCSGEVLLLENTKVQQQET